MIGDDDFRFSGTDDEIDTARVIRSETRAAILGMPCPTTQVSTTGIRITDAKRWLPLMEMLALRVDEYIGINAANWIEAQARNQLGVGFHRIFLRKFMFTPDNYPSRFYVAAKALRCLDAAAHDEGQLKRPPEFLWQPELYDLGAQYVADPSLTHRDALWVETEHVAARAAEVISNVLASYRAEKESRAQGLFVDCAFPDACECAARGYAKTRDACAAYCGDDYTPLVGMQSLGLFGGYLAHRVPSDELTMPLLHREGLALAIYRTISAMGEHPPFHQKEFGRILHEEKYGEELRADAGIGSGFGRFLYVTVQRQSQKLCSGKSLSARLVLDERAAQGGPGMYWDVGLEGTDPIRCANAVKRDAEMERLRIAEGGDSGPLETTWRSVPTVAEIKEMT